MDSLENNQIPSILLNTRKFNIETKWKFMNDNIFEENDNTSNKGNTSFELDTESPSKQSPFSDRLFDYSKPIHFTSIIKINPLGENC